MAMAPSKVNLKEQSSERLAFWLEYVKLRLIYIGLGLFDLFLRHPFDFCTLTSSHTAFLALLRVRYLCFVLELSPDSRLAARLAFLILRSRLRTWLLRFLLKLVRCSPRYTFLGPCLGWRRLLPSRRSLVFIILVDLGGRFRCLGSAFLYC